MIDNNNRPILRVTEVGEFIRHNSCERRFKLGFNNREQGRRLPFSERLFNALDPVLQETGKRREEEWERSLRDGHGFTNLNLNAGLTSQDSMVWNEFCAALKSLKKGENAYAREVELEGDVGAFKLVGRVDFIIITWCGDFPKVRLVECKASRRDRTYHRLQIALYKILFNELVELQSLVIGDVDLDLSNLECVVARIDESTNEGLPILGLRPLELDLITSDVMNLLGNNGLLKKISESELDDLDFKLEPKCDGCIFNVDCFPEAARLRRLQLLSIDPSDIRILKSHNISSIDELAELDLDSQIANAIRNSPGFSGGLDILVARGQARLTTLPKENTNQKDYQVKPLPARWASQLPSHEVSGNRLVRIYLTVDYDYTENRIGALSAHITNSQGEVKTRFEDTPEGLRPSPRLAEIDKDGRATDGLFGESITRYKTSRWAGRVEEDNGSEKEIIQSFFHELVEAIARVSSSKIATIHFYVWSRSEMNHLVEGCTRGGSDLLGHLKELLGCRESLEQLIFSCLSEEVSNRFALGWTSTGLSVVSSLKWFGDSYHWTREIGGEIVKLDEVFEQDIFDFKTTLSLSGKEWAQKEDNEAAKYKFEIRSRFYDSLPAPYWHAIWRTLPTPNSKGLPTNLSSAIKRYNRASEPNRLRAYLQARTHALRWIEEHIKYKNDGIHKIPLNINDLQQFTLGIDKVSKSAVDFLQLEQHIRFSHWISAHLVSPINRVALGRTIPLRDIICDDKFLIGHIDTSNFDTSLDELSSRSVIHESAFARLIPYNGDPNSPQSISQLQRLGSTCVVESLDWDTGQIVMSILPMKNDSVDRFRLPSFSNYKRGHKINFATLEESPSDYVAYRVATRLEKVNNSSIYRWFDPLSPRIPEQSRLSQKEEEVISQTLLDIRFENGFRLSNDQRNAVISGLDTTVQLLQGPPGTGKTQTTAVAALMRIYRELSNGDVVLVVGNTHTSVDNLLYRIERLRESFKGALEQNGLTSPSICIAKVDSNDPKKPLEPPILNILANSCTRQVNQLRKEAVLIIGGTTSAILKMTSKLDGTAKFRNGFLTKLLIVDEASMMVFPSFLALASILSESGKVMLSGDNRQLSPILAHDWEREDRPPVVLYQPFFSAYDSIDALTRFRAVTETSVRRSALTYTYRLPPVVRSLIAKLYEQDEIVLQGPDKQTVDENINEQDALAIMWGGLGLFLVVHDERESRKRNPVEAKIIKMIMQAVGSIDDDSVAVITPHRAQRTLLKEELAPFEKQVPIIDTVERLQGDQRQTIIISATASDPIAIAASVEFILDLNRSNVAFSRVQNRLIVVCSETLLTHIAPDIENYESAVLWKSLRKICSREEASFSVAGNKATVFVPDKKYLATLKSKTT